MQDQIGTPPAEETTERNETSRLTKMVKFVWRLIGLLTVMFVLITFMTLPALAIYRLSNGLASTLIILLPALPLLFITFDIAIQFFNNTSGEKREAMYNPNLQIWGLGLMLGVGVYIVYLFNKVVSAILNDTSNQRKLIESMINPSSSGNYIMVSPSGDVLWQNIALLLALTLAIGFLILGVVKIVKSE